MASIKDSANIIITKCLGLKPAEKCLIITDELRAEIGRVLYDSAKKISNNVEYIEIPVAKVNGHEPSQYAAEKMLEYDVIIMPTTKSLSHTNARIEATKKGIRMATLPGITEDIMKRAIDVDYDEMKKLTNKLCDILDKGKTVRITTKLGTDITINIDKRQGKGRKAGLFTKKGDWGNLPDAESFIAPNQKGTDGVYIVDATQAGVGKLKTPIKVTVKDGFAVKIEGKNEAKMLNKLLESINNPNAYNIAELGIGTNKKAKITGITLEDEKVFGTCHIALGKNDSFGGAVNVPIHVDGVIKSPTIYVDGRIILKDNKIFA